MSFGESKAWELTSEELEYGWDRFLSYAVGSFGASLLGTCSCSRLGAGVSAKGGQYSQTPSQQYSRFLPLHKPLCNPFISQPFQQLDRVVQDMKVRA